MNGCRPIVEFMTFNFSLVGIDQIINNAAKIRPDEWWTVELSNRFPWTYCFCRSVRSNSLSGIRKLVCKLPGTKVVVPSNPYDAKGLLKTAIQDNDPVIFMESEQMYGDKMEIPEEEYYIPIGKADIKKEGSDVTLVSFGKIMKLAIQAAEDLEKEGISVEVIDLRTVRPLDYDTILTSVKKTNRLVVLEEAWPFASVASEITYMVQQKAFDYLDAPIKRITTPDAPAPYSAALFAEWFPKLEKVKAEIKNAMYVKQ
jgi:pyruvate dehydrogenase E1 component beta subunit